MKNKDGLSEKEFLENYNVDEYERPSVTVDDLFLTINELPNDDVRKLSDKKLQVLLLKRSNHPEINKWALPGVFVKMNESLEEASIRALKEKTDFRDLYMEQLYTFGDTKRDKRTRVISVAYMSLVAKTEVRLKEVAEHEESSWFTIDLLEDKENVVLMLDNGSVILKAKIKIQNDDIQIISNEGIAFDHAKIIYYGILRLRNKIEYTDVAFSLVPEKFTFLELQQVYELILNKKFTKANFQRKVKSRVIETGSYRNAGFRPARLYSYKENKDLNVK